jgi:hypothetical protein
MSRTREVRDKGRGMRRGRDEWKEGGEGSRRGIRWGRNEQKEGGEGERRGMRWGRDEWKEEKEGWKKMNEVGERLEERTEG